MVSERKKQRDTQKNQTQTKLQTENHSLYTYVLDNFYTNCFISFAFYFKFFQLIDVNKITNLTVNYFLHINKFFHAQNR